MNNTVQTMRIRTLRLYSFGLVVFTLYLSLFPMLHRHGKIVTVENCVACTLYNRTHAKQVPSFHAFLFHKDIVSSLVAFTNHYRSHEAFLDTFLRAPPHDLA